MVEEIVKIKIRTLGRIQIDDFFVKNHNSTLIISEKAIKYEYFYLKGSDLSEGFGKCLRAPSVEDVFEDFDNGYYTTPEYFKWKHKFENEEDLNIVSKLFESIKDISNESIKTDTIKDRYALKMKIIIYLRDGTEKRVATIFKDKIPAEPKYFREIADLILKLIPSNELVPFYLEH